MFDPIVCKIKTLVDGQVQEALSRRQEQGKTAIIKVKSQRTLLAPLKKLLTRFEGHHPGRGIWSEFILEEVTRERKSERDCQATYRCVSSSFAKGLPL